LDLPLISESEDQIAKYLNNIGYFFSHVSYDIKYKGKKAKKVTYFVTLSEPYKIVNIEYRISDQAIRNLVLADTSESILKRQMTYNTFVLDQERLRIAKLLNNNGYFSFSRDYVYYEVDSSLNEKSMNIAVTIKNILIPSSNPNIPPREERHKVYYINDIYIHPEYKSLLADTVNLDTLEVNYERRGDEVTHEYKFVYTPPMKIRPKVIMRSMFIEKDRKYNSTDAQQTYKKISNLRIFKYVDIKFKVSDTVIKMPDGRNYLDCTVHLTRFPVHSYSIEAQGTNSGGDLGVGGYLVYQNKNLFRGGEVFNLKIKGALEAQEGGSAADEVKQRKLLFFNTYETGIEANLNIPQFLAPINQDVFSRYFRPTTTVNIGYYLQDRLEYQRTINNYSFGYEWSETKMKSHTLYPVDINYVKVNTTGAFDSILANESERYKNQYKDHMILGLKYSYVYNNQDINKLGNYIFFRGNIETSGNLLGLVKNITDSPSLPEGYKTIFGIRYSQYVKADIDLRSFLNMSRKHSIAMRVTGGAAVPYWNSKDIPFEKGFYGGGANGMRAWPLRFLGPGAYRNTNPNIERVGDVMLEGSLEYRFNIYKVVEGALFYDIGNIWYLSENETFPEGKFTLKNFAKELAMDAGIGIRLDFTYFIFRVDVAQRMKDPAFAEGTRWIIGKNKNWINPWLNLGIGYPF
jgi:outer membrane protein assembly factor BamA